MALNLEYQRRPDPELQAELFSRLLGEEAAGTDFLINFAATSGRSAIVSGARQYIFRCRTQRRSAIYIQM